VDSVQFQGYAFDTPDMVLFIYFTVFCCCLAGLLISIRKPIRPIVSRKGNGSVWRC